jgi:CHAT domain-containing protein
MYDDARQAFLLGDLPRAETEAHAGYQQFTQRDQEWAWRFRLLDAEVLVMQRNGGAALSLLGATLPTQLAHGYLAIKQLILQGSAYISLDRFEDADRRLNAAEELATSSGSALADEIARARGVLHMRQNDLEGAERFFRQSLRLARQQHDAHLEMTDLVNLGAIAQQRSHYDESIDWLNDAYKAAQALRDRRLASAALGNQAVDYYKMGDFDRALTMYQDAEKTATDLVAVNYRIQWLNNIGLVYDQQNRFPLAEDYYHRSLTLAQANDNSRQVIDALTELAFVSVQQSHLDQAQQYSEQALQKIHEKDNDDRASELYAILVQGQIAVARGNPKEAEKVFREVASDKQSDLSLRWGAQSDLARLYEQQHQLPAADKQYRAALATIEQARSSLQHEEFKLPFMANAAHLYDDYIHFLLAQGKDSQALQLADYSRARTLAEGLGVPQTKSATLPQALSAEQVARQAHATILFYWVGQERSYLWAITSQSTTRYELPKAAEIDATVQRYRQALLGWQDVLQTQNPDGIHLYETLVKPARKQIAPNSRVILITDGSLDNLNFETLLVPDPKPHYWIEDATILSASSLRVLSAAKAPRGRPENGPAAERRNIAAHGASRGYDAAQEPAPKGRKKTNETELLLIGDALTSRDYAPLPNAALELQDVAKHFPATAEKIYTRDQATPAAYTSTDPGQFSFIHFVAHATASKLTPLDSAIVLSPANAEPDSFKLYARDIKQHPLRAELVTISSCNGAGTQAYSGEGLVGLSWAFLRAGAHHVIGALWEVSDASTAQLMDQLYAGLQQGKPPEAALRQAKLSLLHSEGVFRKPFYWAPFQLYTGR